MFDQLLESLSLELQPAGRHFKIAYDQLKDGDTRSSTVDRLGRYSSVIMNESISFDSVHAHDCVSLLEKSNETGIPFFLLKEAYLRKGMSLVDWLIAESKKDIPKEEEKPIEKTGDVESQYHELLTKLDTPEELSKIAAEVNSFDDIEHHYSPDDFVMKIDEHLSREERIRKKITFARDAAKRGTAKKLALKRLSSAPKIKQKARRQAINMLKERLAKKPVDQLTTSEKERLEDVLAKRKDLVNRLANKIAPKIRKLEQQRLSSHHLKEDAGPKGMRSPSEDKEEVVEIGPDGQEIIKSHSPEAVFDDGGVEDENYQVQ